MLIPNLYDKFDEFFFYHFPQNIRFYISCKLLPQTICMKSQTLFSGKNKKKMFKNVICWDFYQSILRFNSFPACMWQLLSFADNLCKHFGSRSGPTKSRAWSGSKLFDTLMVFLKDFSKKLKKKKIHRWQKSMENYPTCKEVKHQS